MAYTQNPNLPKVRGQAVELVRKGWSTRKVARHCGFSHSAVVKWKKKAEVWGYGSIPTQSSKPKHHPLSLSRELVEAIISERMGRSRCAEHVHHTLKNKGVLVSLSSVKRVLNRCHLIKKRSPWKRPHDYTERPVVTACGALLQADTVHFVLPDGSRLYVYTLIDLFSRWAYAEVVERISAQRSARFIEQAQKSASFLFVMVQTDHGSEFSTWFTHALVTQGIALRHSRVRQSNDNAHIERFNRTLQEECVDQTVHTVVGFKHALREYLFWYNTERSHMGINYQTPLSLVPRY
ncbi:MAG TPA: hypothetical protein DCZ84_00880 [Candidatus Vogelbacteria bacterium]|uniref:Integrase catalytic domain-containing protein n=1 Tax=Candidatus Vogelbacteria bacterium RIFOXYD1_FULL_51_18 TaxID=1802440 RepID=A0A1G2QKU4_9BACT|nr:MAG: integrase catalytic region [Parcubacteria group bacterium GW2011_GWC1_51_35]KKW25968.1 MAG: Integrase catalytic region [Parcubacteria group bacterium GW2011_GWF2_52_12]KKW27367.1 MAG: Integrase catalytic region [Parcubacteria group bacterium GW2011_GWF1_52_5]OHA60622.1 MAG: hypothetical protein A2569_00920 [Candidatus Vogelbacteria bacterium RIFOXYD1_FULL_51_18]HBB65179.1 hypothetical protein [Candidatus Vogelbacteria bacterium]